MINKPSGALARVNDNNREITDRFQLVINGVEVINAYFELVDPKEQEERLWEQADLNAKGDEDAIVMDKAEKEGGMFRVPPSFSV